jgi:hypothetical protein
VLVATIRKLLVKEVGEDRDPRPWTNFDGMLTSVRNVNDMPGTATEVQVSHIRLGGGGGWSACERRLAWSHNTWRRLAAHGWCVTRQRQRSLRFFWPAWADSCVHTLRSVNELTPSPGCWQVRAERVFSNLLPNLGIGWVTPLWRSAVQPVVPQWMGNYAFVLVFLTLFPWLMGPLKVRTRGSASRVSAPRLAPSISFASTQQQELHPPHHLRLHPARAPPAPSPTPPPSKSSRSNRRARAPPTATPQRASRVSQTNEEKGRGLIRYGACGVVGCTRDRGRTRWRWRCPRRCARCSSASRRW